MKLLLRKIRGYCQQTYRPALFCLFLIVLGSLILSIFKQPPGALILPPNAEEPEEAPLEQTTEKPSIQSMSLRYEADLSETAIEEMENGRFIVETQLPTGEARQRVFTQLRNRGGIVVVRDVKNDYYLLSSEGERVALEQANITHNSYALHRPRRISHADSKLLGSSQADPGDIPYLVMPKEFEARIISEIEHHSPNPISEYLKANLSLTSSRAGHLTLTINELTENSGEVLQALGEAVYGL